MALFTVTDYDKKVYEEELKDFLPEKILDVHTHVWLDELVDPDDVETGDNKRTVTWPGLVAKDNSIEDFLFSFIEKCCNICIRHCLFFCTKSAVFFPRFLLCIVRTIKT